MESGSSEMGEDLVHEFVLDHLDEVVKDELEGRAKYENGHLTVLQPHHHQSLTNGHFDPSRKMLSLAVTTPCILPPTGNGVGEGTTYGVPAGNLMSPTLSQHDPVKFNSPSRQNQPFTDQANEGWLSLRRPQYGDYCPSPCSDHQSCGGGEPSGKGSGMLSGSGSRTPLDEEQLTSLTVRELNKCLHGFSREEVVMLKRKRRTLKNRGYAQICRTKRMAQRHELEGRLRVSQVEIARLRQEIDRACQERDYYKQQCLQRSCGGANSTPSSPEFYL